MYTHTCTYIGFVKYVFLLSVFVFLHFVNVNSQEVFSCSHTYQRCASVYVQHVSVENQSWCVPTCVWVEVTDCVFVCMCVTDLLETESQKLLPSPSP